MGLNTYDKKRDFKKTPEPPGREVVSNPDNLEFVVQKHAARKLHYDFRLECNGVLLSWSVPKGPSLSPEEKRLAVRTEDHPKDYGSFEGVIPRGEYGGGTVMLWDRGRWEPIGDAEAGLHKGRLSFRLFGERLHGAFTLVQMKGQGDEVWLLTKTRDEYAEEADVPAVVEQFDTSVTTGRSTDEITGSASKKRRAPTKAQRPAVAPTERDLLKFKGARCGDVPWPVSPQLPALVKEAAQGEKWLHELKLDGYRLMVRLVDGEVTLFTRSAQDWTERLRPVADFIEQAFTVNDAIVDGELVAFDSQGRSAFNNLQIALKGKKQNLYFLAFDLLQIGRVDLRGVALIERKELLRTLINPAQDRVRFSDHVLAQGGDVFDQACRLATEGVVSKRIDSPYREGRSRDWVKVKCAGREEFLVGGYVTRQTNPLASLLLGRIEQGRFVYVGRVGTGFDREDVAELLRRFKALHSKSSPFGEQKLPTYSGDKLHWLKPELLVEVRFADWTHHGIVRQASYLGIREDKPTPPIPPQKASVDLSNIRISHPKKVLYPESGVTKGELAAWVALMAEWMLPHVVERPLMLLRCPSGRTGQCFFQKHHENLPNSVQPVWLPGDSEPLITIVDAEGLLSLIQMGTLEIHPWGCRVDSPESPDRLIFDLDPDPAVDFATLVEAVGEVRDFLGELGLESWLRWTGGKGFHLVVPLEPRHTWAEVKDFAKAAAQALVRQNPKRYVAVATKAKRPGKIFIDWLRNGAGSTAVAAWSPRAREHAPVAVPLPWSALKADMDLSGYRVPMVQPPDVDPWRGFFATEQTLPVLK